MSFNIRSNTAGQYDIDMKIHSTTENEGRSVFTFMARKKSSTKSDLQTGRGSFVSRYDFSYIF